MKQWGNNHKVVRFQPPQEYIGAAELFERGQIKEYKPLWFDERNDHEHELKHVVYDNIANMLSDVLSFNRPRYHLIRTHTGTKSEDTIDNFIEVFRNNKFMDYYLINYDLFDTSNINDILITEPTKHTFIFIKEDYVLL